MKPQTALVGLNKWNRSSTIQPPNPLAWFGQQFGSKLRRVLRSVPPFMIPLRINNRLPHRYLNTMEVEPLPTPKLKSTDPHNSNNVVDHHSHAQPRNGSWASCSTRIRTSFLARKRLRSAVQQHYCCTVTDRSAASTFLRPPGHKGSEATKSGLFLLSR